MHERNPQLEKKLGRFEILRSEVVGISADRTCNTLRVGGKTGVAQVFGLFGDSIERTGDRFEHAAPFAHAHVFKRFWDPDHVISFAPGRMSRGAGITFEFWCCTSYGNRSGYKQIMPAMRLLHGTRSNSKCYSDLCASNKTRGAVGLQRCVPPRVRFRQVSSSRACGMTSHGPNVLGSIIRLGCGSRRSRDMFELSAHFTLRVLDQAEDIGSRPATSSLTLVEFE